MMEEAGTRKLLTEEDLELVKSMSKSLMDDEFISKILGNGAQYEKSIFWQESTTGLMCKARPDIWHSRFIVDLKTVRDASEKAFRWDIIEYGYDVQAAMIQDGIKAVTGQEMEGFFFVVVEKTPPFAVGIYQLHADSISLGREKYIGAIQRYKECTETNLWPSYPMKVITLPSYAY
jgi:exodeoxyribonuclease VIII